MTVHSIYDWFNMKKRNVYVSTNVMFSQQKVQLLNKLVNTNSPTQTYVTLISACIVYEMKNGRINISSIILNNELVCFDSINSNVATLL